LPRVYKTTASRHSNLPLKLVMQLQTGKTDRHKKERKKSARREPELYMLKKV